MTDDPMRPLPYSSVMARERRMRQYEKAQNQRLKDIQHRVAGQMFAIKRTLFRPPEAIRLRMEIEVSQ